MGSIAECIAFACPVAAMCNLCGRPPLPAPRTTWYVLHTRPHERMTCSPVRGRAGVVLPPAWPLDRPPPPHPACVQTGVQQPQVCELSSVGHVWHALPQLQRTGGVSVAPSPTPTAHVALWLGRGGGTMLGRGWRSGGHAAVARVVRVGLRRCSLLGPQAAVAVIVVLGAGVRCLPTHPCPVERGVLHQGPRAGHSVPDRQLP
jgi:hypothetical protein